MVLKALKIKKIKFWKKKKIIQQKKLFLVMSIKKSFRVKKKSFSLQKERQDLLQNVAKQRAKAREILLKNLNPILKNYMQENNVRVVIDKKSILLADETLDLTKKSWKN